MVDTISLCKHLSPAFFARNRSGQVSLIILKTAVDRLYLFEKRAEMTIFAFDHTHHLGEYATHPLARPVKRRALSFLLA